eukprot:scaffold3618_cov129-Cylindrotheca_fusiformis.AAC.11
MELQTISAEEEAYSQDEASCSNNTTTDDDAYEGSESEEVEEDLDDEHFLMRRSLLFLCQEGQIRIARQRLEHVSVGENSIQQQQQHHQLKKELFQVARDKNYALHEILMGGTSDTNALAMTELILETGKIWKGPFLTMLNAQPPSHRRTALHWAAWGNAALPILQALTRANPEALVLKDGLSQGSRTPLEIFRHYFPTIHIGDDVSSTVDEKLKFLETATKSWTRHRLRLKIHMAAIWYFRTQKLTPFDNNDRKENKIKPRPWFCLSVLGELLQREMQPLALRVLGFVGNDAAVHSNRKKRKQRREKQNGSKKGRIKQG